MTVMEAVKRSKTSLLFNKEAIQATQLMLTPSENILWAQVSNIFIHPVRGELSTELPPLSDMLTGVLAVTDLRVLFVQSRFGKRTTREIPLSSIRSMDSKSNYILEVLRITGISNMIITFGSGDLINHLRNAVNEALEGKIAPQTAAPIEPSDNTELNNSDIEQLQKLKMLYDTGVITAEEFAAKKAQILDL